MKLSALFVVVVAACSSRKEPAPRPAPEPGPSGPATGSNAPPGDTPPPAAAGKRYDALSRADFNRLAVRENLPIYWIADTNNDKSLQPDEVSTLLFYPTQGNWVASSAFTKDFEAAYDKILVASKAPLDAQGDEAKRRKLVGEDLDQGRATLVRSDLASLSADDKAFVAHMLKVAQLIDRLYEMQNGSLALADKLPADAASHSLFRRNRGPKCAAPATEKDPLCSAIPGSPKPA